MFNPNVLKIANLTHYTLVALLSFQDLESIIVLNMKLNIHVKKVLLINFFLLQNNYDQHMIVYLFKEKNI